MYTIISATVTTHIYQRRQILLWSRSDISHHRSESPTQLKELNLSSVWIGLWVYVQNAVPLVQVCRWFIIQMQNPKNIQKQSLLSESNESLQAGPCNWTCTHPQKRIPWGAPQDTLTHVYTQQYSIWELKYMQVLNFNIKIKFDVSTKSMVVSSQLTAPVRLWQPKFDSRLVRYFAILLPTSTLSCH